MIRKIIHIDEEKCDGCGLCAEACHEGAIGIVNGRAKLLRDDYCDGFGDCLPSCPSGAISFVEREAVPYDEAAVLKNKASACPGSRVELLDSLNQSSALRQWPVQIQLAPVKAPYFENADLLVSADCAAYAYGNFHEDYMKNKVTLIGCPKLDAVDYSRKLSEILKNNDVRSIIVVRMQVPCCGGLERAVSSAVSESGKSVPCSVITISTDGRIL